MVAVFRLILLICLVTAIASCGGQATVTPTPSAANSRASAPASASSTPTATNEQIACQLPVFQAAANAHTAGFVSFPSGRFQSDPSGLGGYYDWPLRRWLGLNVGAISQDGLRDAQADTNGIKVVDLQTGQERVFPTGGAFDNVLYFAREGVYFNHFPGSQPGLWLLDPSTGKVQTIFTDRDVEAVGGYAAWVPEINPADQHPYSTPDGILPNQVIRRDLNTNGTRSWFYRPGANVGVIGFTAQKQPLILVETGSEPLDSIWLVPDANNGQEIYSGTHPSFWADSHGVWISNSQGIYLWTGHGLSKMSSYAGQIGGACH